MSEAEKIAIMSINANFHARKIAHEVFLEPSCFRMAWDYQKVRREGKIPYIFGFYSQGVTVGSWRVKSAHYDLIGLDPRSCVKEQPVAIIHWLGTDIVNAYENKLHGEKRMFEKLAHPNIIHLVELDVLGRELKELMPEIEPQIVPLPPSQTFDVDPYDNENPLVSVYMPTMRHDFYRFALILEVAKKFPDVRFEFYYYYDNRKDEVLLDGTTNCWRVPARDALGMKKQIARSKLFLRVPIHDGLSVQVLEFATAGRSIVYIYDLPHLDFFESSDDLEADTARLSLLVGKALEREQPNQEMADYYRVYHSKEKYLSQMQQIITLAEEKARA